MEIKLKKIELLRVACYFSADKKLSTQRQFADQEIALESGGNSVGFVCTLVMEKVQERL